MSMANEKAICALGMNTGGILYLYLIINGDVAVDKKRNYLAFNDFRTTKAMKKHLEYLKKIKKILILIIYFLILLIYFF